MENQNNEISKLREFKLTTMALKNKTSMFLMTFMILLFGAISYINLPKELFPDITFPYVMVQTTYPGNPPVDIENLVTRPIEKELESIKGIKTIKSTSSQDASMIFIEFNSNVKIDDALEDVQEAVDKSKSELPNDLPMDPMVRDIDFSEFPIININLSGDYSIDELKKFSEKLEERFETVSEVSKVVTQGVSEKEIKINVDPLKMESFKVGFGDIEGAIAQENISMSGGEVKLGGTRRTVRTTGEFTSLDEVRNIVVKHEDNNIVYLWQIADVYEDYEEATSYTRLFHKPVVSLQVVKKSGENLLSAIAQIMKMLDEARDENVIPDEEQLKITTTNDQSDLIKKQLSSLEDSMAMSIIFVIIVLYLFLGTRNALFVGLAIPLSMFMSFAILDLIGFKINMIVLFALILALGMLVDNAIVVVEVIYRYIFQGHSKFSAAKNAVGEIAWPIIASTATTVAAFLPLAYWDSMIGSFMVYLPVTLVIVLASSLFVALFITPVFSSSFVKTNEEKPSLKRGLIIAGGFGLIGLMIKPAIGLNLFIISTAMTLLNVYVFYRIGETFQKKFLPWLENFYLRIIRFSLKGRNPVYFFFGTFIMLFLTMGFYFGNNPKVELFPTNDPDYINLKVELPLGTDITTTDSMVMVIEKDIDRFLEKEMEMGIVKSVLANVGKGAVGENDMNSTGGSMPNKGLITITFVDYEIRQGVKTSEVMKMLTDSLSGRYPGVIVSFEKNRMGPPTGKPINIEVTGDDYTKLIQYADTVKKIIDDSDIEGIEELKLDVETGKQEMIITIDRDKARRFGLSTVMIAGALRTAIYGKDISDYKIGEDEYPMQLRLDDKYRYNIPALMNQKLTFRNTRGKLVQVPISSVISYENSTTFGSVKRKDLKRVITISSNAVEGFNANEINEQIKKLLDGYQMPEYFEGYKYSFGGGEMQNQQESMDFIVVAFGIAAALIFLILVIQFNSLVKPFIIFTSVLFSTIGVFGGLATFNMSFIVVMTGIGIISLAGVAVNNAIVLIDYIDLLKGRKKEELGLAENNDLPWSDVKDCIVMAGKTRLRPVLLTAITTILGLLPMAIGLNISFEGLLNNLDPNFYIGGNMAMFWSNMSWTVIFGLTFATFLTLVLVPVMYYLARRVKYWGLSLGGNMKRKKAVL
ncbi:MAG: copper transporter [Bacteroidetes bacterium GWF2_38_335]|nr:MAG: copper transporter [Bacteroidetes bacterium GWF2_38_335]OFY81213.1 MAG: copper transporter [Bacteroidetes bacterium RIFOXYA12_FULL_38_20]HBS85329.1 copper transporter [Bacteroidales bacterium]